MWIPDVNTNLDVSSLIQVTWSLTAPGTARRIGVGYMHPL